MTRLTKFSQNNERYVTNAIVGVLDGDGYYGEAVEKLAKVENLLEYLTERQDFIHMELERLRDVGKEKTVTFKELLTEKMVNDMILTRLGRLGLK